VQDRFRSMFDETFVHVIQVITGYLRRPKNLIQRMKVTCPCIIDSRWLSMDHLLNWLIDKQQDIQLHFCKQNPPCWPPDKWWREVYTLANIVEIINITFKALQGKQLLLDAQKEHLRKLQQELTWIAGISTCGVDLQNIPGVFQLECFQVSLALVESFLLNLGPTYFMELINLYKARNEAHYKMLLERIANFLLHLAYRLYMSEPQRNENNTARVGSCPAAMPFSLAEAGAFMFSTTIMEQKECLAVSFMEEEIDSIEVQLKIFLRKYHNDEVLSIL
jgi:hypothetical protein